MFSNTAPCSTTDSSASTTTTGGYVVGCRSAAGRAAGGDGEMDEAGVAGGGGGVGGFPAVFGGVLGRRGGERGGRGGGQYLRGLLVQRGERRNAENLAEAVEGATARALQYFLTEAPWDTGPLIGRLQAYLGERLGAPEGVFVVDDTGFPKQGDK